MNDIAMVKTFFLKDIINAEFLNLTVTGTQLDNTLIRQISATYFSGREVNVSFHKRSLLPGAPPKRFMAIADKKLINGMEGVLYSPVMVMCKEATDSHVRDVDTEDEGVIRRIIQRLHSFRPEYSLAAHALSDVCFRIVDGFYVRIGEPSGIEPCHMVYQSNGNFELSNVSDFFPNELDVQSTSIRIRSDTDPVTIVILFDVTKHNLEEDCPYLFVALEDNYVLRSITLDDAEKVGEAYAFLKPYTFKR